MTNSKEHQEDQKAADKVPVSDQICDYINASILPTPKKVFTKNKNVPTISRDKIKVGHKRS